MKKKLVALVALAAMVLSLLPGAAFAADDSSTTTSNIEIEAINFNNNTTAPYDNVIIRITGSDAKGSYPIICRINNSVYSGVNGTLNNYYVSGNEYLIYIPKSDIEEIGNATAKNTIAITIMNSDWNKVIESETFYQSYVATMPQEMTVSADNKIGNDDRTFTVKFDADYVPASGDQSAVQGLDEDGDVIGTTSYDSITESKLTTGADGMRTMTTKYFDFNDKAVAARVTFCRNSEASKTLTEDVELESPYGELDELVLDFGDKLVERGETVTGTLYYVNTDGQRYDVTDEADGFMFNAASGIIASSKEDEPTVTIADNATLGGSVTALAFYGGKNVTTVLSVIEKLDPGDVSMAKSSGYSGQDTGVEFQLLDDNGNPMKLNFFPNQTVDIRWIDSSVSDPGFKVNMTDMGSNLQSQGIIRAAVQCDKPCTGKFELTFTDDKGHAYQVVSDTFTFKDPDAKVQNVELTIGSTTMKVDGSNVTMDVAPLIYQNRTYVPLRAVSQAVGADVDYKDGKVTIDLDDTHIVMTPGSLTYTVNGVTKTTDAAPYIIADAGRTMVPFRVIGEALGYDVEAVSRPDGTTSGVIFEAK